MTHVCVKKGLVMDFCDMSVIYLLIFISIILALVFLVAFLWAVKSGQYEDDYSPSVRILMEDKPLNIEEENTNQTTV